MAATALRLTGGTGTAAATTGGAATGLSCTGTTKDASADASTMRATGSRSPFASLLETKGAAVDLTASTGSYCAPVSAPSVG